MKFGRIPERPGKTPSAPRRDRILGVFFLKCMATTRRQNSDVRLYGALFTKTEKIYRCYVAVVHSLVFCTKTRRVNYVQGKSGSADYSSGIFYARRMQAAQV
jgi:hypothetical protein